MRIYQGLLHRICAEFFVGIVGRMVILRYASGYE